MQKLKGEDAKMRLDIHKAAASVNAQGDTRLLVEYALPTSVLLALIDDGFAVTFNKPLGSQEDGAHFVLTWSGTYPWLGLPT